LQSKNSQHRNGLNRGNFSDSLNLIVVKRRNTCIEKGRDDQASHVLFQFQPVIQSYDWHTSQGNEWSLSGHRIRSMQNKKYSLGTKFSRVQVIQKPPRRILAKTSGWPITTVSHSPMVRATLYFSSIANNQHKISDVRGPFCQIV
jgi:hypothetical protein